MGLFNRKHHDTGDVDVVKGPSLARVPTHLIGTVLLTFGLLALINHNDFPAFGDNFTDGTATGSTFLGIGVNGWTAWLCIATGGLLLFGAAQHLAARTMALVVGLILGAAAVIALRDGDDVLGLAYANGWTKLALGATAALLLLTALLPRTRKTVHHDHDHGHRDVDVATATPQHREHVAEEPVHRTGRFDRDRDREPVSAEEHVLAGGAAERAHEAREHHAEPRTEVVRPAETSGTTGPTSTRGVTGTGPMESSGGTFPGDAGRPDSLGHEPTRNHMTGTPPTGSPVTGTHRSGGLVGRLRRMGDR